MNCIEMFRTDAERTRERHSVVPFVEGIDEEMNIFCEKVMEEVIVLGRRAEGQRRRVEWEKAKLAEALGGVSLG